MKTQCIVLGKESLPRRAKPIKFEHHINDIGVLTTSMASPESYSYVELICRNYSSQLGDMMYAYHDIDRRLGVVYFGKWNDGVV